ncbi:MAG: hypothetical protein ABJH08_04305 [Balneola sp.]
METVLAIFVLLSPLLWIISLVTLNGWKHFWKFFFANLFILVSYFYILLFTNLIEFGHDEYGLAALGTTLLTISTHILLGFLFAMTYKFRKTTSNLTAY